MTRPQNDRAARVLIVSGDIGQGHEAVARAVHTTVTRDRPDCDIRVAEAFARMGHGSGPVFRWLFEFAVQWTPLLQEGWYAAVTHSRLVRWFYREVMGAWVARALRADLAGGPTDVVVSTHQLATAGLAWLRRRGLLDARIVAAVCDFAPHAYWTYPGVDEYLVLDDLAREPTRRMDPGAHVTVRSPLVGAPFGPVGDDEARAARRGLGLPEDALVVVVTAGSLGLGGVAGAVRAALAADPRCHVVALCGRDERARTRLKALRARMRAGERLRVPGWVDDVPTLLAAADVVVNNSGGATAQEALACGRTLVIHQPLPGHGRDSARLLGAAGLARTCRRPRQLTALLRSWIADPAALAAAHARAARWSARHARVDLAAVLGLPAPVPVEEPAVAGPDDELPPRLVGSVR
ncbi:MGDG synthase family glycosyltransferase [Actinomycetospora sp. TBRC 11914]|uniref:MGDG synthase family glycosyltransferase n=1 Tax=Actinomycetospora sp. TBRC 11914 TaxID=2729387 RepID=UPI00145E52A7|nr:glycosyltransferase [Actinomycetospora sp. TBRC 11914]NMO92129.1 glycosyltransferase [Actinomycetospora sp. TBRC 11914]